MTLQRRRCFFSPILLLLAAGCSDPSTTTPTEVTASCKNVIVYRLSGDVSLTAAHRYDDAGNIVEYVETNTLGDDVFTLTRTFDARNRRITQVIDTTRFEPAHREMTWEYDEQDRVLRSTYEGWGQSKTFRDTRIIYDVLGRRDHIEITENEVRVDDLRYAYIEGEPFNSPR